eukprot:TRINITY_DN6444_c0_g2_i8.p3 TRINITY_DN6444_c0_g2~~TRINITY_DN6444_c0_g2_i8.p3  ORF type:complete len:124 (-),score=25.10 TRINITY_DN6444_c0_g2_i8:83-454(-)
MKELYLNDNWVKGEEAICLLANVIRECKGLRTLDLSDNNIGNEFSVKLFEILVESGSHIEELYYNYNEVEQEAVIKCLEATVKLPSLKILEMEGNEITEEIMENYEELVSKIQLKLCEVNEDN